MEEGEQSCNSNEQRDDETKPICETVMHKTVKRQFVLKANDSRKCEDISFSHRGRTLIQYDNTLSFVNVA